RLSGPSYVSFSSISDDGRYVGYSGPGVLSRTEAHVYDRATGTMLFDSNTLTGGQFFVDFTAPQASADGRYIAFNSSSTTLVVGDNNINQDVFVYDRVSSAAELISVRPDGHQFSGGSGLFALSEDARYALFGSGELGHSELYLRDRATQTTVDIGAGGYA